MDDERAACVVAAAALAEQVYDHDQHAASGGRLQLDLGRRRQAQAVCIDRVRGERGRVQFALFYVPELHAAFAMWSGARNWRDYKRCLSSAPAAIGPGGGAAAASAAAAADPGSSSAPRERGPAAVSLQVPAALREACLQVLPRLQQGLSAIRAADGAAAEGAAAPSAAAPPTLAEWPSAQEQLLTGSLRQQGPAQGSGGAAALHAPLVAAPPPAAGSGAAASSRGMSSSGSRPQRRRRPLSLWLGGHSLGGSVAQVALLDLLASGHLLAELAHGGCVTWGSHTVVQASVVAPAAGCCGDGGGAQEAGGGGSHAAVWATHGALVELLEQPGRGAGGQPADREASSSGADGGAGDGARRRPLVLHFVHQQDVVPGMVSALLARGARRALAAASTAAGPHLLSRLRLRPGYLPGEAEQQHTGSEDAGVGAASRPRPSAGSRAAAADLLEPLLEAAERGSAPAGPVECDPAPVAPPPAAGTDSMQHSTAGALRKAAGGLVRPLCGCLPWFRSSTAAAGSVQQHEAAPAGGSSTPAAAGLAIRAATTSSSHQVAYVPFGTTCILREAPLPPSGGSPSTSGSGSSSAPQPTSHTTSSCPVCLQQAFGFSRAALVRLLVEPRSCFRWGPIAGLYCSPALVSVAAHKSPSMLHS